MKKSIVLIISLFWLQTYSQADIFKIARNGTVAELKSIIAKNPNAINSVNEQGSTPLILACYHNNEAVAFELIAKGAKINEKIDMGTALMAAVVKGNVSIAEKLLENGANPDLKDGNQSTALIYATLFKNVEIIKLLLKYKADKNVKDSRNFSALDYAKLSNEKEIIQLLN